MKKENLLVLAIFILVVVGAFALMGGFGSGEQDTGGNGSYFMHIPFKSQNGDTVNLASFKGKTVVLHFWATWCPPCKSEIPDLNDYYRDIRNRQDVVLVAVTLDQSGFSAVKTFAKKTPMDFDHYWDNSEDLARAFNVESIPSTYILDSQGNLRAELIGPQNWSSTSLRREIERLSHS